jgi:ATP-dependent DNA helicase RecQ
MIFGDNSLAEMCKVFPQSLDSFAKISGVGEKKLLEFGERFVDVINAYCKEKGIEENFETRKEKAKSTTKKIKPQKITSTILETEKLLKKKLTIQQIAKTRKLATSTVASHI